MRYLGSFFPERPDPEHTEIFRPYFAIIFQNHGAQDAPLDEILNGCIVDSKEFLRALPLDGDKGFCPALASFQGFSRLVCQVFCQQDAPLDEILFEDTLELVFKWRPSRIPRNKYFGSPNKATG